MKELLVRVISKKRDESKDEVRRKNGADGISDIEHVASEGMERMG
jgi:hypothetical protein